jgi:hypothetical protein
MWDRSLRVVVYDWVTKRCDVDHGHCVQKSVDCIAQGFVNIVIMVECMPLVGMIFVVLSDLSGCGIGWMHVQDQLEDL